MRSTNVTLSTAGSFATKPFAAAPPVVGSSDVTRKNRVGSFASDRATHTRALSFAVTRSVGSVSVTCVSAPPVTTVVPGLVGPRCTSPCASVCSYHARYTYVALTVSDPPLATTVSISSGPT